MTGTGDIAPLVAGAGEQRPRHHRRDYLVGTFAGLIAVIVVGALFITAEYRRGLIRTTLAASPRRGRVLAAKAIVIGSAAFVAGLVARRGRGARSATELARGNGSSVYPVSRGRPSCGSSSAPRRCSPWPRSSRWPSAPCCAAAPARSPSSSWRSCCRTSCRSPPCCRPAPAEWLLRLTPAAAFAVQQACAAVPQVSADYIPSTGYFPLAPWAGFAVLCGWTALALAWPAVLLRRRDA